MHERHQGDGLKKRVHLAGAGGVGMSALATALDALGAKVTGSDRNLATPNIAFLRSIGIECFPDDGSGIKASPPDELVVSTAIEEGNGDLIAAKEAGIPVVHRAVALADALSTRKLVAVVGTCGKSTVTAMLGHVLSECGFDPMCVNGANVPGWKGAVRVGAGSYAVAEVDESDRSLTAFSPYAAIVTNSSADHYSKEEMDEVFDAFVKDVPGPVVDGRRDAIPKDVDVSVPGRHNRENAALALAMALRLGCDETQARAALLSFKGVERRLQKYGENVYDDYAHNPEKLKAMWTAVAEAHPEGGICAIWRPHGYGPLRKMLLALADMFSSTVRPCDKLLLLPVYDAGGTAERTISSADLAALLPQGSAELVESLDEAAEWVGKNGVGRYAAFVVCGARDPLLPALAKRISSSLR